MTLKDGAEDQRAESVIELMSDRLASGGDSPLQSVFQAAGALVPQVVWSPERRSLRNPLTRRFFDICEGWCDEAGRLYEKRIRLGDLGSLMDWIILVEVVDDGRDFCYQSVGHAITESYGRDIGGALASEFPAPIGAFLVALYRAALRRDEWVWSEHEPVENVFVRAWQRLTVPVHDDAGRIKSFLILSWPDNELRAGLEIMVDPTFVLTEDHEVVFLNRAATRAFGIEGEEWRGRSLEELTDVTVEFPATAAELLEQRRREDSVALVIRDGIVERLVTTVSATSHSSRAFYVVVMRLIGT